MIFKDGGYNIAVEQDYVMTTQAVRFGSVCLVRREGRMEAVAVTEEVNSLLYALVSNNASLDGYLGR